MKIIFPLFSRLTGTKILLEIDMAVVKYGQEKLLNRDNGNFVKTNAWKPLFRKMKTLH